jgi:hypothetical protein
MKKEIKLYYTEYTMKDSVVLKVTKLTSVVEVECNAYSSTNLKKRMPDYDGFYLRHELKRYIPVS